MIELTFKNSGETIKLCLDFLWNAYWMPILCEELSQSLRVSPENPFDCKFLNVGPVIFNL